MLITAAAIALAAVANVGSAASPWTAPSVEGALDLSGTWTVAARAGPGAGNCSEPVNATVPGDIYTDLHRAGVIDDPLEAFGDWKTAWAGRTSWTYTKPFSLSDAQQATLVGGGVAVLVAEGIETNASVLINKKPVISASDSWVTYKAEVQSLLQSGTNTLTVVFDSVYDACEFSDPFHSNVTCAGRVYVRQAASSWGWDWAKRYSPQGIWRPISIVLVPAGEGVVTDISAVVSQAKGRPAGTFAVDVTVTVHSPAVHSTDVDVTGAWPGEKSSISAFVRLQPGENVVQLYLEATDVALWWPSGYGAQPMYNVTATVSSSSMTRAVGFRTVHLQTDSGAARPGEKTGSGNSSMIFLVNGRCVFVRGSSLVPLDTFNGRTSEAKARRLLRSTISANMNALRVWGGGTFLPRPFYDMADELGVMLIHDFMLSWYPGNPYPAFPAFRQRLAAEAEQRFTALARHPSIVMWNGGNEDQCSKYDPKRADACRPGSTFWYPDCEQVYKDCVAVYVDTVLQTAAKCTSVPLWPVSPSAGWASGVDTATGLPNGDALVERDDASATVTRWNQGALDVHGPYSSPHAPGSLFANEGMVLFHSEFGELAFPQFETLVEALPDPAMWSVHSSAQAQRSPNGAERVVDFVQGTFGPGLADWDAPNETAFRRVAYVSQLAQSEGLRAIVDGGRLGVAAGAAGDGPGGGGVSGPLDRPWGFLFWQLNDVTQGFSWGSLEYGGRFKIAHHAARRWFAPLRIECNLVPVPQAAEQRQEGGSAVENGSKLGSPTCTFAPDTDYGGPGRPVPNTPTQAQCCSWCQADAQCVVGVLQGHTCWFKYSGDAPVRRPGVVACKTSKLPPAPKSAVVCTVANDGAEPWSGQVSLAVAPLGGNGALGGADAPSLSWSQTFYVGPVEPGHAARFYARNTTDVTCRGKSAVACWLYGAQGPTPSRADIGLPLEPVKDLVATGRLPATTVAASVVSANATGAEIELTAGPSAAALYVHVTAAPAGQFSDSAFHMLPGEKRRLRFVAWVEAGPFDAALFAGSLHVHCLNQASERDH